MYRQKTQQGPFPKGLAVTISDRQKQHRALLLDKRLKSRGFALPAPPGTTVARWAMRAPPHVLGRSAAIRDAVLRRRDEEERSPSKRGRLPGALSFRDQSVPAPDGRGRAEVGASLPQATRDARRPQAPPHQP